MSFIMRRILAPSAVMILAFVPVVEAPAAEKTVTLSAPTTRQVVQRDGKDIGRVPISGTVPEGTETIEVMARLSSGGKRGKSIDWKVLAARTEIKDGRFEATLDLEAGGWYTLSVRAKGREGVLTETQAPMVGVGDVYVTAGQSNSANFAQPRQSAKDDRVVYFDGKGFVPANDPIPGACGQAGSVWPLLGDLLVESQNVPVCFRSATLNWAEVKYWLPGTGLYANLVKCVSQFGANGVRAVLWHQGESDSGARTPTNVYYDRLKRVIESLNKDAGYEIPWFVCQASFHPGPRQAFQLQVAKAQQQLWQDKVAWRGAVTDDLLGPEYRCDGVHFNQKGLNVFAQRFFDAIAAQYGFKKPSGKMPQATSQQSAR
jgi:hypothetical protein